MKKILVLVAWMLVMCAFKPASRMAAVRDGQFMVDGKPYYFVGVNFWYGAILGSQGEGGDRDRLSRELDALKKLGVTNLRVLVGSDGARDTATTEFQAAPDGQGSQVFGQAVRSSKVQPTLQIAPGVYNDTILDGLDYLMVELNKRDMKAVLYLNNTWEWSGGYGQYLEWAHQGEESPVMQTQRGPMKMSWARRTNLFYKDPKATAMFENYVRDIVTRTNRYSGLKYIDDPAIFSWQIGNEPRPLGKDNHEVFVKWIESSAKQLRSRDPNHMISTGNEGEMGCDNNLELTEAINAIPEITYITIHIWPFNWGWIRQKTIQENLPVAKEKTKAYLDMHVNIAKKYGKPITLEEFGYPRDDFAFKTGTPTTARDAYYEYVFSLISDAKAQKGLFSGCNLWAWGGFAIPAKDHDYWYKGDDYTGDPAQEQQGLNSVFMGDTKTIELIKNVNKTLSKK